MTGASRRRSSLGILGSLNGDPATLYFYDPWKGNDDE